MTTPRRIGRIVTRPPLAKGFLGSGHLAAPVVEGGDFPSTDPFIMMMDDHLDFGERVLTGAHPHAGFETVTFMLDGDIYDRDEGGVVGAGDVQWMTAGIGIIHGEEMGLKNKVRLLQLWLTLPKADRWTTPGFTTIRGNEVPVRREAGAEVRIYSGRSGNLQSPTPTHLPVTLLDVRLQADATLEQHLPLTYNGFVFVIQGAVTVGADDTSLATGQIGWLDRPSGTGDSSLNIRAGAGGARLLLYAGEPQHDDIVSHGPFIGDTRADISRLISEYQRGAFPRLSELQASTASR